MFQDMALAVSTVREPESEGKPQKSLNEKQQVSSYIYALNILNLLQIVKTNFHLTLPPLIF